MKYKLVNGYTKETVIKNITEGNKGVKAVISGGGGSGSVCVYLTPDGNKCAIGCFIPEGSEASRFHGSVSYLVDKYPDLMSFMPLDDVFALRQFQRVHDNYYIGADPRPALIKWIEENTYEGE